MNTMAMIALFCSTQHGIDQRECRAQIETCARAQMKDKQDKDAVFLCTIERIKQREDVRKVQARKGFTRIQQK